MQASYRPTRQPGRPRAGARRTALLTALSAVSLASAAPMLRTPRVTVRTDRDSGFYSCGDPAVFTVLVTSDGQPATNGTGTVRLTLDGGNLLAEHPFDLARRNPFTVTNTLAEPGFIRCDFKQVSSYPHPLGTLAAAGFDVEKIRQGHPEPADFDAYWAGCFARQEAIADAVAVSPLPAAVGKPGYDSFRVAVKTIDGGSIYGYLGVPAGRPGPFAALVIVQAYGPGYDAPDPTFIRPDMMTLSLNVHPLDPTQPRAEYAAAFKKLTAEKAYMYLGAPDRDRYYFRNAVIGTRAAVRWLVGDPRFNGKDLLYLGSSQGGGFGMILGGLCPEFTRITLCVPALCDHGGEALGRRAGWPYLVRTVAGEDEALRQRTLAMSGYFDAANFARRIRCPVFVAAGLVDTTCPPSSVYAAYNAIPSVKFITTLPLSGHAVPWEQLNGVWQWLQNGMDESHRAYRPYFKY